MIIFEQKNVQKMFLLQKKVKKTIKFVKTLIIQKGFFMFYWLEKLKKDENTRKTEHTKKKRKERKTQEAKTWKRQLKIGK